MSEAVSEAVAGEARAFNAKLEAMLATQPSVHTLPAELVRAARRAGKGIFPPPVFLRDATWVDANGVKLRVVRPPGPARGVYLHIHGGGWTLGAADMQDLYLRDLASATGLVAASVEYRLAPEHPFPAGADDCEIAARWLVDGGARKLDAPAHLAIGGESAGAHLAALVLVRLRTGFSAANLVYGAFDLGMTPSQRAWGERNLVLSGPIIEYFGNCFLPGVSLSSAARRRSRRSTRTSRVSRRRCSPSARSIRCSTTRCSWKRAGGSPATRRRCGSGLTRCTASTASISSSVGSVTPISSRFSVELCRLDRAVGDRLHEYRVVCGDLIGGDERELRDRAIELVGLTGIARQHRRIRRPRVALRERLAAHPRVLDER